MMKKILLVLILMIINHYMIAKETDVILQNCIPIHKPNFSYKDINTKIGKVTTIELANTESQYWKFDSTINQFVNNSIKSSIQYQTNASYKKPVKLYISCPDIQDGLEVEVKAEPVNPFDIVSKNGQFQFKDYHQGNVLKQQLSLSRDKQVLIDDIYNCKVKLNLNYVVRFDTRITANQKIRINYELSDY